MPVWSYQNGCNLFEIEKKVRRYDVLLTILSAIIPNRLHLRYNCYPQTRASFVNSCYGYARIRLFVRCWCKRLGNKKIKLLCLFIFYKLILKKLSAYVNEPCAVVRAGAAVSTAILYDYGSWARPNYQLWPVGRGHMKQLLTTCLPADRQRLS